jgi:sugar phosphate isomerase/epimerase
MRLGGPIFLKSDDPAELAQEHLRLGYRAAYVPRVEINETDRIKAIIKEFAARDVAIAEVGAWCNMLDPDAEKRSKNLAHVQERLALADRVGARCRTRFSIEMMPFNFPTGPDDYLKLIKKVDRKQFGAHLDVCNVMNCPERMYNNSAVIDECFQKLGPWIVSCHAKDLSWEDYVQVSLREVIPGRGQIDYRAYLRGLSGLPVDAPLMLEHLKTAEEYDEGRHHIQSVARDMGLSFGGDGA